MKKFRNIGIALDNSKMDDVLLNSVLSIDGQLADIDEIHLLHARNLNYLDLQYIIENKEYGSFDVEYREKIKNELCESVASILGDKFKDKITAHVFNGSPTEEFINYQHENKLDLLIVGKKKKKRKSGKTAKELLRRFESPVLVIPEEFDNSWSLSNILIPYDFSKLSDEAVIYGVEIIKEHNDIKIECLYAMDSPLLTSEMISSSQRLYSSMEESRKLDFTNKMKGLGLEDNITLKLKHTLNNFVAREILYYAKKNKFNLIIMGAKGHSSIERFFLGSVTEKTITSNNSLPLLIVK